MTKLIGALFLLATALFVAWLLAGPVKAEADQRKNFCTSTVQAVDILNEYREKCGDPLEFSNRFVMLCRNDFTGSWSMVVVRERFMCFIAVGIDRRPAT